MHCIRCGKPLKAAAVIVQTRTGQAMWGPKCAFRAGLLQRKRATRESQAVRTEEGQMDWIDSGARAFSAEEMAA